MEPREIFDLIVKADEALKYATPAKAAARAEQARRWLTEARDQAAAIGDRPLIEQAERRLADLDAPGPSPGPAADDPGPAPGG